MRILLPTLLLLAAPLCAATGDPQVKTDHPWYPGELSCSTFERLFKTQAALYQRVTGRGVAADEDKALAAWYWRNLNYWHGEEGKCNYFGKGYTDGAWNREYWHGLFAHGHALCGTTHAQWTAEMEHLLGHCRGRVVGVSGHNSFEVFLKGGAYGDGKWALLDHDISTVIFAPNGSRLLSIQEIKADLATLKNPNFKPERQRGWRVAGLHDSDAGSYAEYNSAEYLSGYAGPPPLLQLRANETLRRYLKPGLDDGKTFVYWGLNYQTRDIPGPERWGTWVNQPEKMFNAKAAVPRADGQARFANAVYTYAPNFADGSYKDAVVDESPEQVTLEFQTPFVIAATPAKSEKGWVIYEPGGKNGLVLRGKAACAVKISIDRGKTWRDAGNLTDALDLTDHVKGHQQYWLRFMAGAKTLAAAPLTITTVCQTNSSLIPRVKDGGTAVTYLASGQGIVSAGPTKPQAEAHVVDGAFGTPRVTLELAAPRGEKAIALYAAAHVASSNPPDPQIKYQIEYSLDAGKSWQPVVKDWNLERRAPEPAEFWSQSHVYGNCKLPETAGPVRVRFRNDGGKNHLKAEAHLIYSVSKPAPVAVTFAWKENNGPVKQASHTFAATAGKEQTWSFASGEKTETLWVEYQAK